VGASYPRPYSYTASARLDLARLASASTSDGEITADLLVVEHMRLLGGVAHLFDRDRVEIGEKGFAGPAHGRIDDPLEEHRICAKRDTLRHFLGVLLEADEPEAMLACLRRLAERKAHYAIRGALVDRQAAERWLRLAEALVTVERQVIASKH
jgi:hypothetical protein